MDNEMTKNFNELKSSILANQNATKEEVAIWFDLNCKTSCRELIKIFKAIIHEYHDINDLNFGNFAALQTVYPHYDSDIMFKNIFYVMFETDLLNEAMSSKRFIDFVKTAKNDCKKTAARKMKSKIALDLFEVFAELLDKIEEKFKK